MTIIIRPEQENEYLEIYNMVEAAFRTAQVSNGKEQDFVTQLRTSGNYIAPLALVAEEAGKIIGHIMFTKTYIVSGESKTETLFIAPLSVVLEYRNQGVGSLLVKEGLKLAKKLGYKSVFLVGNPLYYQRFGFRASIEFGIKNNYGIPDENVLAAELVTDALAGIGGAITW